MSSFCICVVEDIKRDNELVFYMQQLEILAQNHKRGIKFFIDWPEPIISRIQENSLIINILDCPESNNCELFLQPDGWYSNGRTDKLAFRERMHFLQDIAKFFIYRKHSVDLYIGQSGADPEDFFDITLKSNDLADFLTKTVGVVGVDDGVHIGVIP